MLGKFGVKAGTYGQGAKGIFLRRELPQLEPAIARAKQIYEPLGARWAEMKKTFTFPNGATLKFRSLERDEHADKYQGHDYTDVFFEELTNYPSSKPVMKMKATLRSALGIPCQFHGTANPGGPGHQWVKSRYIAPAPGGWSILTESFRNPFTGETVVGERIYIPSRLSDNHYLGAEYVANLYQSGSEALVRAWLDGDWDVIEGAYFDCWRSAKHVIRPFQVPADWTLFGSFDWGFAKPASYGLWAVSNGEFVTNMDGARVAYPAGAMIRVSEIYTCGDEPNVGLRLEVEALADRIAEREKHFHPVKYRVADPSIFRQDGGPSIHERMLDRKINFIPADNSRVTGWSSVRQRMIGDVPMIYAFSTCTDSIRTIPALMHDENNPEDLDTEGEDHAADEWRYACMSRPKVKKPVDKPTPLFPPAVTYGMVEDIFEARRSRR